MADSSFISSLPQTVVYVNPTAGGGRALSCLPRIRRVFEAASLHAEFIFIQSAGDLESNALAAINGGQRLLLAFGGDGTFQALVNAAYGSDAILGVLPAGGGNDFAAALQLPNDPVAAAQAVLRAQPRRVDLARARTADGRMRFYLGGGGLGVDAEAARHATGAFRRWPGRSRYIASALRAFCTSRAIGVRAEFPQSDLPPLEVNSLLAAVLNTPTYGAGIRLAPDARLDDGWLDVVIVEDLSVFQVLALLPRLLMSGELRTPHIKRLRVQAVKFTTDRQCMFHGDGEILGPTPVKIEVVPGAVRVLAPAQN
ncbi:MAG TPA: diacylglycerol kinase family protein [Candidatus Acidoferrum sp.]|nr:diacylglycerol kinase family protein [Candidatus Acidoferrum sp.]